jgi:hypothetical protein
VVCSSYVFFQTAPTKLVTYVERVPLNFRDKPNLLLQYVLSLCILIITKELRQDKGMEELVTLLHFLYVAGIFNTL